VQVTDGSGWSTYPGLLGYGFNYLEPLRIGELTVALVALVVPAVICGLLPSGTGVRAGSITGWLAAIGALLIGQSILAAHLATSGWPGVRPTPAFWVSWVVWVIALALGIALPAADRRRRALSAR